MRAPAYLAVFRAGYLSYKEKSRGLWRHALLPLRDTYLLCERLWRSTRSRR